MFDFFRSTTLNVNFDGYYGYNFNEPVGQVNLLRAYDVTSNSFNINQADLILERLPTPGSRFGGRLDWDARAIVRDDRAFGGRGAPPPCSPKSS